MSPLHCSFCGTPVESIGTWYCRVIEYKTKRRLTVTRIYLPVCVGCAERHSPQQMGVIYDHAVPECLNGHEEAD